MKPQLTCPATNTPAAQKLTFPDALLPIYIAFLAWDKFTATHVVGGLAGAPKAPGSSDADFDPDTEKVTSIALKLADDLVQQAKYDIDEDDFATAKAQIRDLTQELVRAGGGELHNIAALTGGIVSQEVIKAITEQYVPVDNTCVFDGVRSKSSVFKV